ncbi:MAG: N-acetyltransferase family protein [Pseudomonadota bacterium]
MQEIIIRDATRDDLPAILAIYNHAVLHTTAIWNETVSDLKGRETWWRDRTDNSLPVFVVDVNGTSAGFATYGPFRPNHGYKHTRELSIYVDERFRRRGLATRLLKALETHARANHVHVLVGGIEAKNSASIDLHLKHGFSETARMKEVGRKFDRWLDLILMQKILT